MDIELLDNNDDEKDYNLLIESLEIKINQKYNNLLKVQGKLLHETKNINIFYFIFIHKSTEINPFEADIEINVEFIENEPPYIQIMTNFLEPTLYDLKNYFLCLSKKTDYIFKYKYLGKSQIVLLDIISNIQSFLYHLYNCELSKTFIYFGEYQLNHIYHINNFLKNAEILDFFRINRIENEKLFDKIFYIIVTELYLIAFEPENSNKSLAKILFFKKLTEISIKFEEIYYYLDNKLKKKLKLIIEDVEKRILFKENNINLMNEKVRIFDINYNLELLNNNNNNNNIRNEKTNLIFTKSMNKKSLTNNIKKEDVLCYKYEFIIINKNDNEESDEDKDEDNIKDEYEYFKKIELKRLVILKKEYKTIISPYWLLFNCLKTINLDRYSLDKNKSEINKLIEYNETLIKKYLRRKSNYEKKIANNAINNIIFLCTEITTCLINDKDNIINFYITKLKKYSQLKI